MPKRRQNTAVRVADSGDVASEINIPIRLRGALARDCQMLLDPEHGYYGSASELARDALRRLVEDYRKRDAIS